MPALIENTVSIDLETAKPKGLVMSQLGVPVVEGTEIKKGKLNEFMQALDSGNTGRRYQNLRVTAVKTVEGGVASAKLFLQFEVFGDDNAPVGPIGAIAATLVSSAGESLALGGGAVFLPYACSWYENQFVFELPLPAFDSAAQLRFTALADQVRLF